MPFLPAITHKSVTSRSRPTATKFQPKPSQLSQSPLIQARSHGGGGEGGLSPQGPANKYISLRDRRSRREDTIFGAKFSIRLFRYYIKFLNKENMHTYSYGVLLYSDGRMPPLVALFADLYQFCTRYVKSNNDLCSADVLTIARNTRQVNTSAEHRSLLLVSCPPFSTYGLGVRYRPICSLAPVAQPPWKNLSPP